MIRSTIGIPLVLTLMFNMTSASAVSVKTSIDVEAEISTSVRVFVDGKDVTDGSIGVTLENKNGYMWGITPKFYFIGNASTVSLTLTEPSNHELISDKQDKMLINTAWILNGNDNGGGVITSAPVNNRPVFPSVGDVPPDYSGVKLRFKSSQRIETYPLGKYSGTYIMMVTPSS